MRGARIDIEGLERVRARLGEASIDPALWVDIMDDVCRAAGATGAALLQGGGDPPDTPVTDGVRDSFDSYFRNGWHLRDLRYERALPLLARGSVSVFTDQDLVTADEMKSAPFYVDQVQGTGFAWFGGIVFFSGPTLWCLSMQRTARQGAFEETDKRLLAALCQPLTEAATLSAAVSRVTLSGVTSALNDVGHPAIALDRRGNVLEANPAATALFDRDFDVSNRRLVTSDRLANRQIQTLVSWTTVAPDTAPLSAEPIVVRRKGRSPIIARVLPVPVAARSPFLSARVLVTLHPVEPVAGPRPPLLMRAFGLTPAEAKVASLMAEGLSTERVAEELGIARETARHHLKAVFAKTGTHRQSELVALLARL